MASDDLDLNPFYRSLQTVFRSKFGEAQKKCWIICVPQISSIKGFKITGQFIDWHVLKPSPYFKGQFVSTDKGETKTVEIEDKSLKLLMSGSYRDYEVKILSEELSYNQDYRPFKMYIIEKPLDPSFQNKRSDNEGKKWGQTEPRITLQDCRQFLSSYSSHATVLQDLDHRIKIFNKNYIILVNYLHDATDRLKEIILWATEAMINTHLDMGNFDPLAMEIKSAVESYVLAQVHPKLFSVIRDKCIREDKSISLRLQELYNLGLTPDQLGVREAFCCPQSKAIVELASLNSKNSPTEKLQCLKMTLEWIPEDIHKSFKDNETPFKKHVEIPTLSSDDLIPLLVSVLVQARPQYLETNLYYIQNFTWNLDDIDKQSFSLVTFQAAKEFILNHDFSHLKPSRQKLKKEMSLEELMSVTAELHKSSTTKSDSRCHLLSPDVPKTNMDHQLKRITKMIEDSTQELRNQENQQANSKENRIVRQVSTGRDLGDFLNNLQQNCLGVSYGKQA